MSYDNVETKEPDSNSKDESTEKERVTENGQLNGTLNGTLNNTQQTVFDEIKANLGVQAQTIIARHGIPRDTLNKVIKYLVTARFIERRGSKKNRRLLGSIN